MKNVRRDDNLISSCSIPYVLNVKMQTKTMHCSCPRVYVRRYPPPQKQGTKKYILLYLKFNYMIRWLRIKSKASKIKKKQENIQICNSNTS